MPSHFDAIIIGTGQAGPPLARSLTAAGQTVAIIERGKYGGTCVNTGCIPTKTMIASAYAAHLARRAADYGVTVPSPIAVDMPRVKARKDAITAQSSTGLEDSLKHLEKCTVFEGHARFESPHEVSVGSARLTADKIFLNVGARAIVPNIPGIDTVPYLNNSSLMAVDFLPPHLLIVGGSYIALEFAQMFRRFGSQVTILQRSSRLAAREDDDVAAAIRQILENEGIHLRFNTSCTRLAKITDGIAASVDTKGVATELHASHILIATGRQPNTADLGLDNAGVHTGDHGYITVNDRLQTNVPHIWALGDCNGKGAFTHTSYNDFEIVAANLLDPSHPRKVSDRITAYALYIDPPLGRAGLTETEVRKTGRPALMATRPMTKVGRAVEKGETQGFMKVLVDADTHSILGASLLGTGCDEAIHSILDVMYTRQPYTVIQNAMHIHPTVSELIPTMLGDLKPL